MPEPEASAAASEASGGGGSQLNAGEGLTVEKVQALVDRLTAVGCTKTKVRSLPPATPSPPSLPPALTGIRLRPTRITTKSLSDSMTLLVPMQGVFRVPGDALDIKVNPQFPIRRAIFAGYLSQVIHRRGPVFRSWRPQLRVATSGRWSAASTSTS